MDLRAKNEPRNNLPEVEELSDLQLESIAGGNKEERKARRKRMWRRIKKWWLGLSKEKLPRYGPGDGDSSKWFK